MSGRLCTMSTPLSVTNGFPLGSLPPELGGMEALRTFQVPSNQLSGEGSKRVNRVVPAMLLYVIYSAY